MIAAIAVSWLLWGARAMTNRLFGFAFLVLTLIAAFWIWRHNDWTAYVEPQHRPKFDLPLWFQIAASLLTGAVLSGGPVLGLKAVVALFGMYRRRNQEPPSSSQRQRLDQVKGCAGSHGGQDPPGHMDTSRPPSHDT